MKNLVVSSVAVLGLASAAFAGGLREAPVAPRAVDNNCCCEMTLRPYINFGLGMANTGWKNFDSDVKRDVGFAWNMGIGCELNKFFSAELAYLHSFNSPKLDGQKVAGNTFAFALLGKLSAPVFEGFNLFAKFGPSLLTTRKGEVKTFDYSRTNFNVAFGAGAEFKVADDLFVTAEWLRVNGRAKGEHKNYQPAADFYTIGVRYVFDI